MKINLPFSWDFDENPITNFKFQLDYEKAGDYEDMTYEEYREFIINLSNGEILWIDECIANGDGYEYSNASNWMVEGNKWWICINENENDGEFEKYYPNKEKCAALENLFSPPGNYKAIFSQIVEMVCDAARINGNEINTEIGDIYKKNINNPDAPSLYD